MDEQEAPWTALSDIAARPIRTARDAERSSEAAQLLAEYLRLQERSRVFLEDNGQATPDADLSGKQLDRAAEAVLRDAGEPLHANELGRRIKARGWSHPRSKVAHENQIYHQLAARLPAFPDIFRKVAPATWALVEWIGQTDAVD